MDRQEKNRRKYQRIRCPKCNGTSTVLSRRSVCGRPGYQIRVCGQCGNVFDYDYAVQSLLQGDRNWNSI